MLAGAAAIRPRAGDRHARVPVAINELPPLLLVVSWFINPRGRAGRRSRQPSDQPITWCAGSGSRAGHLVMDDLAIVRRTWEPSWTGWSSDHHVKEAVFVSVKKRRPFSSSAACLQGQAAVSMCAVFSRRCSDDEQQRSREERDDALLPYDPR